MFLNCENANSKQRSELRGREVSERMWVWSRLQLLSLSLSPDAFMFKGHTKHPRNPPFQVQRLYIPLVFLTVSQIVTASWNDCVLSTAKTRMNALPDLEIRSKHIAVICEVLGNCSDARIHTSYSILS